VVDTPGRVPVKIKTPVVPVTSEPDARTLDSCAVVADGSLDTPVEDKYVY
jgi:hypothetical protein